MRWHSCKVVLTGTVSLLLLLATVVIRRLLECAFQGVAQPKLGLVVALHVILSSIRRLLLIVNENFRVDSPMVNVLGYLRYTLDFTLVLAS